MIMKNKFLIILSLLALFVLPFGFASAMSEGDNDYSPVTYDDSVSFSAILNDDGNVSMLWSKYAHDEDFTYYKVVRSKANNNPVYPDDGYIYYSSELDDLSYVDEEMPNGTVYYRVCQIASPERYCSKVVTINGDSEAVNKEAPKTLGTTAVKTSAEIEAGAYRDLAKTHWANGCVERLSDKGVISGNPDGSFKPNNAVNRAEFLKMIILALYPEMADYATLSCFSDVKSGDWFAKYVCAGYAKNIVKGYDGNMFRPGQSITRAEAVSILVKSLKLPVGAQNSCGFDDVNIGWQRGYVNSAFEYNLVNGYTDNSFRPNNTITRAEAAKLICNALDADIPEEDKVEMSAYDSSADSSAEPEVVEEANEAEIVTPAETPETVTPHAQTNAIIVDHRHTDLSKIPASYIADAKSMFRIAYGHTSHGSQLTTGMEELRGASGSMYYFSKNGEGGLYYNEDLMWGDLGSGGDLSWAEQTREMLNSNSNINLVMWSWCGGQSENSSADVSTYLNAMNQLEQDYPNVTFVYMTGHLDGTGVSGKLHQNNEQIRNYTKANNKVLFDFADIESYDPSGAYFLDKLALDSNEYDSNGDGNPWSGANWADDWCAANPDSELCASNSCAHSTSLNCNLKGRAFWWMMARLAGWSGN